MRRGFLLAAILLFFLMVSPSALAHSLSITATTPEQQPSQPVKTYVRSILPEIPEQVITLDPPATQLMVYIRTGNIVVPCGNQEQVYTCVSGKPVEIISEPEAPIRQVWIQNPLNQMIQLTINVYEQSEISASTQMRVTA